MTPWKSLLGTGLDGRPGGGVDGDENSALSGPLIRQIATQKRYAGLLSRSTTGGVHFFQTFLHPRIEALKIPFDSPHPLCRARITEIT